MIYKVLVDRETLYVPGDQEAVIYSPVVDLAVGDAGQFTFELPEVNPLYDKIRNRQSMVQIFKNGKEIFYGEIRTQKKDSLNTKQVTCVGALAFLFDSVQPQAEYHDLSPRQMMETWLNIHNQKVEKRKQIKIGIVTIHDSNDSLYRCTNQESTLECIRYKLVDRLGGVLRLRHEADGLYLDWITIEEYGKFCEQPIMFGENLMDYSETLDSSDLITACIPRGARLEKKEGDIQALEKYVDITSVNGGKDYVCVQEAVDRFGWVYGVVTWDDVTQPENLKKKAEEYVKDTQFESLVLELTAVDQSLADVNTDDIQLGDRVKVKAKPYGMDKNFPVHQITIHLQAPEEDTFVIGSEGKMTYTQAVSKEQHDANMQAEENNRITTDWLQSAVDNLTQMMTGNEGGYKIEEFDEENRWLRTLIMDAPRKEDAKNLLQFNKYGIGGSHNGFNGPYTVGMTISGDLIGERLLAGSVKAEALSAEYKSSVSDEINTTVTAKFEVAENLISAEVKRAKGAEEELSSSLKLTSEQINAKVSKGEVSSQLSLESDLISLVGPRLEIDTEKFKMAKDGTTRLIDAYMEVSGKGRGATLYGGGIYFSDKLAGLDAGMIAFNPAERMMCVGGFGEYGKAGLGYWSSNDVFKPILTVESTDRGPGIRFNTGFSVIGKEGITEKIGFVDMVSWGPDNTFDLHYKFLNIWNGIITEVTEN
nr:phage tail protein [uncultured Faecalimonas sp.]